MSEFVPGLVSVIVPVYNREGLVGKTLDSILGQTYPHIEIVAVNDGSTDDSLAVLNRYAEKHQGKLDVIDQENSGQVRARNNGLKKARGEYIAFLDSDDTWEKEKLARQIPLFKGNVGLVYCGIREVDPEGRVIRTVLCEPGMRGDIYGQLLVKNRMTGGTVVVNRKSLEKTGMFDESLRAAENWDLWIRISREFDVDYVNGFLVNYLKHQGNISHDSELMTVAAWAILQKHLPSLPENEALKRWYFEAYANYYYNFGVGYFGQENYLAARKMFLESWRCVPNYRDSGLRILRSYCGKNLNRLLSRLRKRFL